MAVNRLQRRSLSIAAVIAATLAGATAHAVPVVEDFTTLPAAPPWFYWAYTGTSATTSGGILTLDTPLGYNEIDLFDMSQPWHATVDNANGWAVEARIWDDPSVPNSANCLGDAMMWIHDHTNLIQFGIGDGIVCLGYPDYVPVYYPTTDGYHTYRIEGVLDHVYVYRDGVLIINHQLIWTGGGGTVDLGFGDFNADYSVGSLTHWDYFSYDTGVCLDGDGDGLTCAADNCPQVYNPTQDDTDGDGIGDSCDDCPTAYDPGQDAACSPTCVTIRRGAPLGNTADTTLLAGQPNSPQGAVANLRAASPTRQSLLWFDTSSISATLVASATVVLEKGPSATGATVTAHEVFTPWSEASTTWNSFYSSPSPYDTTPTDAATVSTSNGAVALDVLDLAKGWLLGSSPNNGVLVSSDAPVTFTSSESSGHPRPELNLCYYP